MSYADQIDQFIDNYPTTASVHVPEALSGITLTAHPHVVVHGWDADFCELQDADWNEIARFKLVG